MDCIYLFIYLFIFLYVIVFLMMKFHISRNMQQTTKLI
jgi:hypothetical protein